MSPRIALLIIASDREPWRTIQIEAQIPLFLKQSSSLVEPLWCLGRSPIEVERAILEKVESRIRRDRYLQILGAATGARPVALDPGKHSRMIDALVGEYESSRVRREGQTLHFDFPDSLATLGHKTLWALQYLQESSSFSHVMRSNTSSFFDFNGLAMAVESLQTGSYAGVNINMGRHIIASGAGMLLSRGRVNEFIANKSLWNHGYMDDQALGVLNARLGFKPPEQLSRFDFNPKAREAGEIRAARDEKKGIYHWRCKSDDYRLTIQRMNDLSRI